MADPRMFRLVRNEDATGVSGTGVVAHGMEFPDGCVVLRWMGKDPTSVVFHDNGVASVEQIHGHDGRTVIEWIDAQEGAAADLRHLAKRSW